MALGAAYSNYKTAVQAAKNSAGERTSDIDSNVGVMRLDRAIGGRMHGLGMGHVFKEDPGAASSLGSDWTTKFTRPMSAVVHS